jgi:hypothetical protein
MRELESLALARLRRLLEDDSVPASVQLRAALTILNRPKRALGIEEWNVPRMESLDATLNRKPHVTEPPAFDTTRQISTLFAVCAEAKAGGAGASACQPRQRENFVAKAYCPEPTVNSALPFSTPAERTPAA